ncbi:MAG: Gfo/Idh/MocA family oxidoreductase [Chloroflexi bacterium]|nr:Gfo/Idh/MocA family oxidoreductase [Anaerolineaceae bacterium]NMB86949.1 Gfo/Idh/MocA family oxidoreductase [Chloroflexota bacterium]
MKNQHVRVGVIGGGTWGNYHLLAAKQLEAEGKVDLVAIADQYEPTAEKQSQAYGIKKYTDFQKMIRDEDLDAVTVATPDHLHREVALYAMDHGKHVLIEKPLDLTTAGCRTMVAAAQSGGLLLTVDFHKRYDVYNAEVMRQVRAGLVGRPYHAYAYMEDKITVPLNLLRNWAAHSSPFWFIGVHKLDLVRWVTGLNPVRVLAHGRKGKLQAQDIDTFDSVSAWIEFENGFTCTIDVNWIIPGQFEALVNQGLRIVGSDGIVELDGQDRGLRYCSTEQGTVTPNLGALVNQESLFGYRAVSGYYVDPIKDFYHNVYFLKNGGSLVQLDGRYPSGMDGQWATQTAEAVEKSIVAGRPVELAEI